MNAPAPVPPLATGKIPVTFVPRLTVFNDANVPNPTIFPFNLLIACKIVSVAVIVPAPETKPVRSFPVTAVSVNDADGSALVASVP